ncbi:MAG: cell division FtsZ family protein [Anaerolineales bacterium]|nr:cell division FtsZ family protein [Anaerolineales bacterium]MCB0019258.1 cell division FtsZ family protein [Anaerolineales bacterium]MCB0028426.1 cell division FtsZ family protein [Anaerolineales bacterium]
MRRSQPNQTVARVCVAGVGSSGGLAINQLKQRGQHQVPCLSLQTDAVAFNSAAADHNLLLGDTLLRGSGTNGDPRLGAEAVKISRQALQQALNGAEILILVAGLGGGTGSGAAPLLAQLARHLGLLTIAVVTTPYPFETQTRKLTAAAGLRALQRHADTTLVLDNERLLKLHGGQLAAPAALHPAVSIVEDCLQTIGDFLCPNGILTVDIEDLRSIMSVGGQAFLARGQADGDDRAVKAAEQATISQQLGATVAEAQGVLVQVRGGSRLSLHEIEAAAAHIRQQMAANVEFAVGAVMDPELGDRLQVSLIATGLRRDSGPVARRAPAGLNPETSRQPGTDGQRTGRYSGPLSLGRLATY